MQKRVWLGVLVLGLPTACILEFGCSGSSSDDSAANGDSGSDVTVADTAAQDVVTTVDAGRCDDADLNTLALPDASLGDSGATTSTCITCMKTDCQTQITACNADCTCKDGVDDALNCVAGAGGLSITCLAGLQSNANATSLGECIYGGCAKECGLGAFLDGGAADAGDGG